MERIHKININSRKESIRFLSGIQARSREIFEKNKDDYMKFIEETLQDFVDTQTDIILTLITIGYDSKIISEYFNETKALDLARKIYSHLYKGVANSMALSWTQNKTGSLGIRAYAL